MPRFEYQVRDHAGEIHTGVLMADSQADASSVLRDAGKFVVKIQKAKKYLSESDANAPIKTAVKNKQAQLVGFCHQLAVMIETGVPIAEALECIADQTEDPGFKGIVQDIAAQVQAGNELSATLERYPKIFPRIVVALIRASEASGTMGSMLERCCTYLEKQRRITRKIRGALTYPAIMISLTVVITIGLLAFVLPRFAGIYGGKGAALPGPTRMLMFLSEQVTTHYIAYGLGSVGLAVGLYFFSRSQTGAGLLDTLKLQGPVIGSLFRKLYISRAFSTFGTLLAAGVPILDCISIVREVTPNKHYSKLWDDVDHNLRQGGQLSEALFETELIPRGVTQMVLSGEKSGKISQVFDKIADYTEQEFDERVKAVTQLIEPVMTIVMGAIIGFVAIALLLPIFSVGRAVS